jgi:nitroreductase
MPRFVPYQPPIVPPQQSLQILQQEYADASRRRSVRHFSDRPVPRTMIEMLIRIAGTAPSGANLQPWTFVAIDDPDLKRRIRAAAEEVEREFYERRAAPEWLAALEPLGTDWTKPFLEVAPWLVVVFRQRWGVRGGRAFKVYYSTESVGIAVGLFIAALHRAGLAALTHTPAPMDFLREICRRPKNESAYVLIPVGYPAPDCQVPHIQRKELGEIVQWNA